jgi:hypothetical protein
MKADWLNWSHVLLKDVRLSASAGWVIQAEACVFVVVQSKGSKYHKTVAEMAADALGRANIQHIQPDFLGNCHRVLLQLP